jgi:hypothetical protein
MQRNVTMIDELPDIDDLEDNQNFVDTRMGLSSEQQKKFIRNTHVINSESGMLETQQPQYQQPQYQQPQYQQPQYQQPQQQFQQIQEPYLHTCLDISKHVENCPICSKLYNNDKSVYIFCIIILVIICLLLLKKVLNV